jgi:hypothetical protein
MKTELIAAVKSHALANYEKHGWDIVVECYSDEQIGEIVAKCRTAKGAISAVQKKVSPHAEYRADIQAEAF